MYSLVTRESVNGKSESGGIILNTQCIAELKTVQSTKAQIKFVPLPEDRRSGADIYVVSETVAAVKTEMDASFNAVTIQLSCYIDNDTSKSTETLTFSAEDIVRCYPNSRASRDTSWIEVNVRGSKLRKYLTNSYYVDVYARARYGTTTTTSTSTTSTTTT